VAVLATVAQRYRDIDAWNTTPVMEQESLERLETVMEQAGELKRSDWVVFEELVDNSYAKAAG
jgi:NitT/TauT family transport system substrate-binding protein